MPTITSTSTSDTSPSSRARSAKTGWKCRRKTVRDSRSKSEDGASEGTCRRRVRGSFLRRPEHRHRQECLCHTILPYLLIRGACETGVAQTLLSVLWQESVPAPANPLQSRAMKRVTSALLVLAITLSVSAATKPKFNVVEASI